MPFPSEPAWRLRWASATGTMDVVETDRERARMQETEIIAALLLAIDRRVDVCEAVASAEDQTDAVDRLRDLLAVSEFEAVEILNMQWRRFTRSDHQALLERLKDLQNRA
jgi:DNA gyrase/topoisomerase IV subunit A